MPERVGHADLLAGRSHGDARAPAQPVGAGLEARVPALSLVELTDQHQETVGGDMDVGGELGDLVAQSLDFGASGGGSGGGWSAGRCGLSIPFERSRSCEVLQDGEQLPGE